MTRTKKKDESLLEQLQLDRLVDEVKDLGQAIGEKGISKLNDVASSSGKALPKMASSVASGDSVVAAGAKAAGSKVKDTVKDALPGGDSGKSSSKKSGSGEETKVTTIIESVDVPVPRTVAYQEWTQFQEFPSFMKKVENVEQQADEKLKWQAQIFWSHRTWEATITEQVPDERIVWKSSGEKGYVDGAVTFHELAPDLTRVLAVLEYHPKGLFERVGNIWRAQGRRARVELKHYQRHVATRTLIHQDEVDGWEGEIRDSEVTSKSGSSGSKASSSRSTAKKSSSSRSSSSRSSGSTRKSTAKKSAPAKKSAAKKAPAKKASTSRSSSTAKKSAPAKKTAAKKSTPAKKTAAAKKSTAGRRTTTKRTTKSSSSRS